MMQGTKGWIDAASGKITCERKAFLFTRKLCYNFLYFRVYLKGLMKQNTKFIIYRVPGDMT